MKSAAREALRKLLPRKGGALGLQRRRFLSPVIPPFSAKRACIMGTPGRARNQGLIPVRLRAAAEAELPGAAGGVQRDRPAMSSTRVGGSILIAARGLAHPA